jgi:Tfp pilus assembly protein PilN
LLGALALIVAMAGAYVLAGKKVDDKRAEVARVTQQAAAAEAKAQSLTSFTKFSALRVKRVDTVTQLAASRFDWSQALREVARVLPTNAWLTTMNGTTSPSVAGGGSGLRGALQVPAIEITGCTTSQASVAKMMARMRLIDGVQQVSLSSSDKGADTSASSGGGSAGGSTGDCRNGHSHFPMFSIVVFYNATSGLPASTTSATQTAAATTSATSSSTTPSSTTPAGTTASSTTPAPTSTTAATGGTTP